MSSVNFQARIDQIHNEKELWNEAQIMIRILTELPYGREVEALALLYNLKFVYYRLVSLRSKSHTT